MTQRRNDARPDGSGDMPPAAFTAATPMPRGGGHVGRPNGLKALGGSAFDILNTVLTNQAFKALWHPPGATPEQRAGEESTAIAAMAEFKPRDAIEGMMAAQAVAAHAAAMECYRRAMIPEQSGDAAQALRKNAASMTRTFVELVDALDRKRGGTRQQVVRIERVQVAPGGQAIVGNVSAGAGSLAGEGEGK